MWALTSTDHIPVGTNKHMSGVTLCFEHQGLIMSKAELVHFRLLLIGEKLLTFLRETLTSGLEIN